jgi:hypothetical protein
MNYHIYLKPSTVYGKSVEVEANSMDEAIKIARVKHCNEEKVAVSYHPEGLQPKPADAGEDWDPELSDEWHEVYHDCDDCGVVLFTSSGEKNPDNDWPWQHDAGDTRHHTYICYPCAMKRKEEGNYCPFFRHFYRSYKEGCDTCPPKCRRAQDAYYERLGKTLAKALSHSQVPPKPVKHLLDNNEFGLAYDLLSHETDSQTNSCREILAEAKAMMEKGWED